MFIRLQNAKILFLAVAIIAGLILHHSEARAQGSASAFVAGGCFWCVEADFESVPGVEEAISGYTGGTVENPSYKQVSRGGTGHYEAVEIRFDPNRVSYARLMDLFFRSIDPTDPGGQFCDRGESYRTAIFVADETQRRAAEAAKARAERALGRDIVTPILPLETFYVAEDRHQDYYRGRNRVLTRFGIKRQADAYKAYRRACRRDERVRELWGDAAPFAGDHS